MSSGPIATAFIKIVPDTASFKTDLQAAVNSAVRDVKVPPIPAATTASIARTGTASRQAAAGVKELSNESNALRGAVIGLSRVTPVTVFGLGVYGTAAIAAGYAIKGALRSTEDFEHQLNIFQATTGATADQMKRVSERAQALGADLTLPSTSAGDAAKAMTELAKAGLSVNSTLAASRGVLQLAAAAQLDVATAADFVATELNAFGLAGNKAVHVADLLAGASIAAQGDIRDFGTAFQQVSAVSRQVGLSLEDTTGALTELALAGLKGADAGTSLRTFLLRLTPTTKQAQQYFDALGISYDHTKTIGSQLGSILDQLNTSTSALNRTQRTQALTQIVGQDAIRSATILIRNGSEGLKEATASANQNGAANRLAQANARGLYGAINGLKNATDNVGISVGNFVKGPLTLLINQVSQAVGWVQSLTNAFAGLKKEIKSQPGGSFVNKLLGTLAQPSLVVPKDFRAEIALLKRGELPKFGESPADALERLNKEAAKEKVPDKILPPEAKGRGGFLTAAQEAAGRQTPAQRRAIQKAIQDLIDKGKKIKELAADTTAPRGLQISQLNAELANNLNAELAADKAIEGYFNKRLSLAKEGSKRYLHILAAEEQAHSATSAIQSQIDQNAKAAASAAKAKRSAAAAEAKKDAADAAQHAKDLFNLEKSQFDLRIQAAGLTKGIGDDVRANRAEIAFFNAQIKRIENIKKRRKLTLDEKQALVDYRTAIIGLRGTIQQLKKDQQNAKSSGFTLEDLFKEAANQLSEFGSNVSTSPTTGGGARAAVAGGILNQRVFDTDVVGRTLAQINRDQLFEQATTNDLLRDILHAQGMDINQHGRRTTIVPAAGFATAVHAGRHATTVPSN